MLRMLLLLRAAWLPAYIDPGAGSLIVQAIIAAAVALPVLFRERIGRAVRFLRRDEQAREARRRDEGLANR